MGRLVPTCAPLVLAIACTRPNELFGLATDGPAVDPGTADMSAGPSDPIYCPDFDPRGDPVELCELGGATPIDLGDLPALADACDAAPRTLHVRRTDAALELCDDACTACADPYPLVADDPRHQLLLDPAILPADTCARLTHAGTRDAAERCTTARLALWIADEPVPRLAAGVDTLAPLADVGLDLRRDAPYTCACTDADKQALARFPCCAAATVRYYDLLVTPDGDCPIRVRRGADDRQSIHVRGQPRTFTLHDAYEYTTACPAAHATVYWTMTP